MEKIAAIVLAAGRSSRMGQDNKLLLTWENGTILTTVLDNLFKAGPAQIYLVTGHNAEAVAETVTHPGITVIHNKDYKTGLAGSLKAGLSALPDNIKAAMICLGDMPELQAEDYRALLSAYEPGGIIVPVKDGRQGNPVLFDRAYFAEMMTLEGDRGAKSLLSKYRDRLIPVPCRHDGIFRDIDTPEDYRNY